MSNRILQLVSPINILIFGSFLVGLGTAIMIPFLTIYLSKNTDLTYSQIGIIVGIAPLAGAFSGAIVGNWADTYGKKNIMVITLIISILSTCLFPFSSTFWGFLIVNLVSGFSRLALHPIAASMLTDLVKDKERATIVMSYDQTAFNFGYVLGMLLATLVISTMSSLIFYVNAFLMFILLGLIVFLVTDNGKNMHVTTSKGNFLESYKGIFKVLVKDKILVWITLGGLLFKLALTQLNSSFPVFMNNEWGDKGITWYSYLIIINTVLVIGAQIIMTKKLVGKNPYALLTISAFVSAISFLIFESYILVLFVVAIIIFTFAEVVYFIGNQKSIIDLSNEENKTLYFGTTNLTIIGTSVGNILGLFILDNFNDSILFLFCVGIFLVSTLCFYRAYQIKNDKVLVGK